MIRVTWLTDSRYVILTELGDEPVAGCDAPVVRRLAGSGRAVRPVYDADVSDGGQVAHENQQRTARGALQPWDGSDGHGDCVWHSHQRIRTDSYRGRSQNSVRDPPLQSRRCADQRPVRSHLQGNVLAF